VSDIKSVPDEILYLPQALAEQLRDLARHASPLECVGVLAGPEENRVSVVHPLSNIAEHPTREYVGDPRDLVRVIKNLRSQGLELTAIYHSHPNGPAEPSRTDLAQAAWEIPYLIVDAKTGEIRAWHLLEGAREVRLEMLD
jgi:[CysO sulfur-carrier protein]-S-L-cysteine hydrolase